MTERDAAARRRLVWLLLTRGDVGGAPLRSDGLPALHSAPTIATPPARGGASKPAPAGDPTRPA